MNAAMIGDNKKILTLVKDGAKVNENSGNGWTALHWVIWQSDQHIDTVHLLLKLGSDPNIRGRELGWTPLQIAAFKGDSEAFDMLVEFGGDLKQIDNDGKSLLHSIANSVTDHNGHLINEYNLIKMAKIIIADNVNINKQSKLGETALMIASGKGHLEIVKLFLSVNANPSIINAKGETAISLAIQYEKNLSNQYKKILNDDPNFYSNYERSKNSLQSLLIKQAEIVKCLTNELPK